MVMCDDDVDRRPWEEKLWKCDKCAPHPAPGHALLANGKTHHDRLCDVCKQNMAMVKDWRLTYEFKSRQLRAFVRLSGCLDEMRAALYELEGMGE